MNAYTLDLFVFILFFLINLTQFGKSNNSIASFVLTKNYDEKIAEGDIRLKKTIFFFLAGTFAYCLLWHKQKQKFFSTQQHFNPIFHNTFKSLRRISLEQDEKKENISRRNTVLNMQKNKTIHRTTILCIAFTSHRQSSCFVYLFKRFLFSFIFFFG